MKLLKFLMKNEAIATTENENRSMLLVDVQWCAKNVIKLRTVHRNFSKNVSRFFLVQLEYEGKKVKTNMDIR